MAANDPTVTVIGDSVQVRGNLTGDEDLHVLGRIEGSIDLQRTLVVAESGIVKAEVQVKNAIISGVVVGNVSASESVEITREGRMVGDISSPRVIIVDGASFRGNIDMGDIENMPARRPRDERPRPAPIVRSDKKKADKPPPALEAPKGDDKVPEPKAAPPTPAPRTEEKSTLTIPVPGGGGGGGKKALLDPPKAKGLKRKNKKRVVIKRR